MGWASQRGALRIAGPALLALGSPVCGRPAQAGHCRTALAAPALTAPARPHSRDSHRGVHAHAGLPCAPIPRVGGCGGRGLEGRAAHGRLPHRGEAGPSPCARGCRPPSPGGLTGPPPRPWPSQVNGVNVVKVGHKQVVALIRQGGNRLVMKVVSVTRKPEEDGARRRGECWVPLLSPALRPLTPGPRSSPRRSPDC